MALEGTLHYLDIAHLFHVVGASLKSGVLEITCENQRARMLFERGRLTGAESSRFRQGIGSLLVKAGLLTGEALEQALTVQRAEGPGARRLGAILCDDFGLRRDDIERQLRRQFELVAFDAFSWPQGRFSFEFHEAKDAHERFQLDPVEFILAVGIEAGFLAEEGLERATAGRPRPHYMFLDEDPDLLLRYREHWQRKGCRVTCCDDAREFLGYLKECDGNLPAVVIGETCLVDGALRADGGLVALRAVRNMHRQIAAVVVSRFGGSDLEREAREAGASSVVARPSGSDLAGKWAQDHLDVFLVGLERALAGSQVR